jgi:hypothetical protein
MYMDTMIDMQMRYGKLTSVLRLQCECIASDYIVDLQITLPLSAATRCSGRPRSWTARFAARLASVFDH